MKGVKGLVMRFNLSRLKAGLARTHNTIMSGIESALTGTSREVLFERLEEALISSDVGVATSMEIVDDLRGVMAGWDLKRLKSHLKDVLFHILKDVEEPLEVKRSPFVIMVVGVNGVGKTTTIGKLASRFKALGKSVLLCAGDTFRAGAIEQLEIWAQRVGCPVIKQTRGGDPGAVAFDAVRASVARDIDVVIIDTAGRLHTKVNLMEELRKIKRVVARELEGAPHENLLVVDATTGQNALNQARLFNDAVGVTGIVITKLDGTAKGGIIVAIARELGIPVRFIGVGEGVEDLRVFNAREFVDALIE